MPKILNKRRIRGTKSSDLSDKQRLLADAYLANGCNATKAAKEAGYKNPGIMGPRILQKPAVKKYLQAQGNKLITEKELRAEDIIRQLTRILTFNVMKAFKSGGGGGFMEVTEEQYDIIAEAIGDCVTEVKTVVKGKEIITKDGDLIQEKETKFLLKLMSKERAIEIMAKYFGLLIDKVDTQQTVNINWNDMFTPRNGQPNPVEQAILEVEAKAVKE
jgi:phage terminase small subunit